MVGLDSNISADEVGEFKKRLKSVQSLDFGEEHLESQVTVAKQRTMFQTQTQKAGEPDVSLKDFLLTWGHGRGKTVYTPDLHTSFGVDRASGQRIRLPTTQWPFDHCGVATELLVGAQDSQLSPAGSVTKAWKAGVFAIWLASGSGR